MNEALINEIRSKADIVDIIRNYIPITKKGKSHVAVCPFHDDHDPSMSISSDKQIYKCFVCGAGGNVFNFVKEFEKISFVEAVQRVANHIHYPLDESFLPKPSVVDPKTQGYLDTLEAYVRYAHYTLASEEGGLAKAYLSKRGLTQSVIDTFDIGYNPKDQKAAKFMEAKGFTLEQCTQTNLVRVNEYGTKDVFEDRIVFPIHDANGHPIAFTARTMNPAENSKYINSSETPLYTKGKVLYNYHRALRIAKQKGFLIVVEGVMDAIAYHQAGFENVVASLGTACTKEQIRLMQNATPLIVLSYDGDEAGQQATLKIGRLLQEHRLKVEVVLNTLGKDPDEILRSYSKEMLAEMVHKRISFTEFMFDHSLKRLDMTNYSQKKEFARMMSLEAQQLKDAFDQAHLMERIQEVTGFAKDQIDLLNPQTASIPKTPVIRLVSTKKYEIEGWAEKEILGQMLVSQQAMQIFRKELGYFVDPLYQKAALMIMNHYRKHESLNLADFLSEVQENRLQELITQIVESDIYYNNYSQIALWDAIRQVKINAIDVQIAQFKQEHKEQLELEHDAKTIELYQALLKKRRDVKNGNEES